MTNPLIHQTVAEFIQEYYFPQVLSGIQQLDEQVLNEVGEKVACRIKEGRRIFGFGNGGSEALSEAFILALEQRISTEFQFDTYSSPTAAEAIFTPNVELYQHRLRRSGRAGDLAVLISASGNSENINRASALCREQGIETVSISANGRVARDPSTKSDVPIVIPVEDQQMLEDITIGAAYLIVEIANHNVEERKISVTEVKERYLALLHAGTPIINPFQIGSLAEAIVNAYTKGRQVRIDAPDSGLLSLNAKHMEHNLKWDAFQDVPRRLTNRTYSGLPTYHISGVSNDGGERFNLAVEIEDNMEPGDVEVLFIREPTSSVVQATQFGAKQKKLYLSPFVFNVDSEHAASNLAQSVMHTTARTVNALLLSHHEDGSTDVDTFRTQLRYDMAMLRQKDLTRERLEQRYTLP